MSQKIYDSSIGYRIHGWQRIDEEKILQWPRIEEGVRQMIIRITVLRVVGRCPFLLVVVIGQTLELIQVSVC